MKNFALIIITSFSLFFTKAKAQSYFPLHNVETNIAPVSNVNGQWIAVTPLNNTLGSNYYQGLSFGFDTNNYASIVNGVGTNDFYFGRWDYAWKGWNKIWHSGNLNNSTSDFTAKTISSSKINLSVPGSGDQIDAFTIDVSSFGTAENAARSSFFRVRDIGGGNWIPFIIKGNGNIGIGTINPLYRLDVIGTIRSREIKVDLAGADFVFGDDYKLMPLNELENYLIINKHLPEIASAEEMQKNGVELGKLNNQLLQKIEELTLYSIEQNKKIEEQSKEIETLKSLVLRVSKIEDKLARK
ncbi:hypothetical protein GKZ90_0018435 [Flavobacterium sp. MC2016-06]|uniref:hypothetical protein n=1 Tax=Flavobacterium sp. MC2016-06 TaxID=2676308 RepID=UPI0012BA5CC5|nr:hypothetical protein [Flavobacterium sp. MC2016-06]MBU3858440.1 hypothetical protein [Flavobacterium sp. MC2016-06]